MPLESCLYECRIWHSRSRPRRHFFSHNHFMLYLALDELTALQSKLRLFKVESRWLYSFDQQDHLPGHTGSSSLDERVRCLARASGVTQEIARIRLLTNARLFNYVFNPVSFFFCFDAAGNLLCCISEVGNTFNEKKAYLLKPGGGETIVERHPKFFYVSPFTELQQDFLFKLKAPGDRLDLAIDTMDGEAAVVRSGITGRRLDLTDANLLNLTLKYPWAGARVMALIHLHAMLLWLKRVPYRKKEELTEKQTNVLRPHRSLRPGKPL